MQKTKLLARKSKNDGESLRLEEAKKRVKDWRLWGTYLPERQWGTVREDYSEDGKPWGSFPFEHADKRAYRWGEDGLLGFCDREGRLCFSVALWNGQDERIKDRLYGLNGDQGNHAEDCKELYYYLDATPTHSYSKALYKYPQAAYPYDQLKFENAIRDRNVPEYELLDTGVLDEDRYFDVQVEYAKGSPNDLLVRVTVSNRGPEMASIQVLPKLWFRNTWIWGCEHEGCTLKPTMQKVSVSKVALQHETLGDFVLRANKASDGVKPEFLFCENETNTQFLYGKEQHTPYVKDGINRYFINNDKAAVNPEKHGTVCAAHYALTLEPGESKTVELRLYAQDEAPRYAFGKRFDDVFAKRILEADTYYEKIAAQGNGRGLTKELKEDRNVVQRQAYAGLIWTKQFYHYSVRDWLQGDEEIAKAPAARHFGRNSDWTHLFNKEIISMPDKWEYPWYAAWDLAFHMVPFADVDPDFAKRQLILFLREWYMHPNGQMPAYEWALGDVNPPVHAWACWQVYKKGRDQGAPDISFLERVFHKLMLNFTWWVNRKDPDGNNLFAGGFLGLDNIGLFDRSKPLPGGGRLMQADGTAWMAFYCSNMLAIALELAKNNSNYEDVASKFFEHFVNIADAMNHFGGSGLWDEEDGFYYDKLRNEENPAASTALKIRSMVGLLPLCAVDILEENTINNLPNFRKRMDWYIANRKDITQQISCMHSDRGNHLYLLAIPSRKKLEALLEYLFDEKEFFSDFGIRSLSRHHEKHPYHMHLDGADYQVQYNPGDSDSWLFGGNSNWRGPVWFPVNYLIIEALETYFDYYGDGFRIEVPKGSGTKLNLKQCADLIRSRLSALFLANENGERPCHGGEKRYQDNEHYQDLILFHEYFHSETGKGLGASHQTGWTALIASLL